MFPLSLYIPRLAVVAMPDPLEQKVMYSPSSVQSLCTKKGVASMLFIPGLLPIEPVISPKANCGDIYPIVCVGAYDGLDQALAVNA